MRALLNDRRQAEVEELVHGMLASGEVAELAEVAPRRRGVGGLDAARLGRVGQAPAAAAAARPFDGWPR